MKFTIFIAVVWASSSAFALPSEQQYGKRSVSKRLFNDFTRAAKLSHCAYMPTCNSPVGTTRIYTIRNDTYDTDGFISRDDKRREIIVAMRGTTTQADVTVDLDNALVQSTLPGSEGCIGCTVHQGFQHQWSAVANDVVRIVRAQLQLYPFYSITVTGHSLGGALTTLAAVTLGKAFPGKVTAYSLASPRTGNPAWINWVESTIPLPKLFRLTNQNDTVPNDLTEAEGYKHHRTEFWSPVLPVTPDNMVICDGGEDPHCNKGVSVENAGFAGINEAHFHYMNIYFKSAAAEC